MVADCPAHIELELAKILIVGVELIFKQTVAVLEQPLTSVPVTEYVQLQNEKKGKQGDCMLEENPQGPAQE